MISWLKLVKSAHFYRRKRSLPKKAMADTFRAMREAVNAPSKNLFFHLKESHDGATWSAICFFFDREPRFLEVPQGRHQERVCGFVLLVEYAGYAVLFKAGLDLPASFRTEYFRKVGADRVDRAVARADATFELIRLRGMTVSKHTLRSKTLEADNLEVVLGPSARYVSSGYRVRRGADHYGATPSTGLISTRSDRVGHGELIAWAKAVIELLDDQNAVISQFMNAFARPIDLASLPPQTLPTYVAIDVSALAEELFDEAPEVQLVRLSSGAFRALLKAEVEAVLSNLGQELRIRKIRKELQVVTAGGIEVATLEIGTTRISLRRLTLPALDDIYIESTNPAEQDSSRVLLRRYINRHEHFTVLFTDLSTVYIEGVLYRDDAIADGGQRFLRYVIADRRLNGAIDEKGTFSAAHQTFDANTVFRAIVDEIAREDDVLICDDLGDEWADFIGINGTSRPKTISFYHAKHHDLSLGAGPLHILVSQAIKNLGRLNLVAGDVARKLAKWNSDYENDGVRTQIHRTVRDHANGLADAISEATLSPDTIRRVFIVTSSLSRQQLADEFTSIQGGARPSVYFVQLYWLLTSYFSACTEFGAHPYVICRD